MSGRRDESLLLGDLIQAASRLVSVVGMLPEGSLGQNPDVDEVVLWNLAVLGEASKRLTSTTRERYSDLPWKQLARTRDVIVHHYEGVNWALIEQICTIDLPAILPRLVEVNDQLRDQFDSEGS